MRMATKKRAGGLCWWVHSAKQTRGWATCTTTYRTSEPYEEARLCDEQQQCEFGISRTEPNRTREVVSKSCRRLHCVLLCNTVDVVQQGPVASIYTTSGLLLYESFKHFEHSILAQYLLYRTVSISTVLSGDRLFRSPHNRRSSLHRGPTLLTTGYCAGLDHMLSA